MGEAKRRKSIDSAYGKQQLVEVAVKQKISPVTGNQGFVVVLKILKKHNHVATFHRTETEAAKAASILNLTFNELLKNDWEEYFAEEGDDCFPADLIPNNVYNQANEIPGTILTGDEDREIIAYSEYYLEDDSWNIIPDGFQEITIPLNGFLPENGADKLEEVNRGCTENGLPPMWSLATIDRIRTRQQIEASLIDDWVKSGIDRQIAILNIYHIKQEMLRKNGGWNN